MERIINRDQEPQSWAQSIQAYQRDKKRLPWNPGEVPPPTYVKHYDVSRRIREMDPILMRHRNPDAEAKKKLREEERLRTALTNAKTKQLRVEQNYNIVTHYSLLPGKKENTVRPTRHPDTRTSYNILNHVPREKANSVALIYADGDGPEVVPQKEVTVDGNKKPHSHMRRDVDVLSNRFLENHEERVVEEQRFLRAAAEEKHRRTHDYNLVAGAYYDEEKEGDFVKAREKLGVLQGSAQQYRLPPSIRYGEGNSFNIINQQPKKTLVKSETSVADRGIIKRTRGRRAHEETIRQHERAAALTEQRALNRPSHMRHTEVLRTGHNVISNQVFTGREGEPPPEPRARPPVPVWKRVSSGPTTGRPQVAAAATAATRSTPARETPRQTGRSHCRTAAPGNCGRSATPPGGGSGGGNGDGGGGSGAHGGRTEENSGDRVEGQTNSLRQPPPGVEHDVEENSGEAVAPTAASNVRPAVPPLNLSGQHT